MPAEPREPLTTPFLYGVVAVWAALIAVAAIVYHAHATTPGDERAAGAPSRWPSASGLPAPTGMTAYLFISPDCPCSRASLANLEAVVRDASRPIATVVVFTEDAGPGDRAWDLAAAIPHVRRIAAPQEAARFGARTSGFTVLYDGAGALRFVGGITADRGHAGSNIGTAALEAVLANEAPITDHHPVFGCALPDRVMSGGAP